MSGLLAAVEARIQGELKVLRPAGELAPLAAPSTSARWPSRGPRRRPRSVFGMAPGRQLAYKGRNLLGEIAMDTPLRSRIARAAAALWRGLDATRRASLNLLLLALLVGLVVGLVSGGPSVKKGAALVVAPKGELVEQLTARTPRGLLSGGFADGAEETLLKDLTDAIRAAKDDPRISSIFLELSELGPAGMTKLQDLRAAIADFRAGGKKVVAYADNYDQRGYAVAAAADEVWLSPQGGVLLEGLGRWRTYYKEGLDRLGVDVHVFRVGEFKSAVEPYTRNGPSPEAREADRKWLTDLWTVWLEEVAASRKLKPADLSAYIDEMPARLAAVKGDPTRLAVESRLVDKVGYRDELRARMIELAGLEEKEKTFKQVSVADYLESRGGDRSGASGRGDAVAVVVARGEILDGKQPAGTIGGDSTAKLIRQARQDDKVKAIVLRVDSPGGSATASEVIRRELVLARKEGKPVVVSMGSVAASGGYWISTASDEIWASPATITGSIGIFGILPTVDRPLARFLGLHVDGVGTTRLSGALRLDRPMQPEVGQMFQSVIDKGYEDFLARVGEARAMPRDAVDRLARGRVWSGRDAAERKLVDRLGGLKEAIASAAERAKLGKEFRTWWVEEERTFGQKLLARLMKDGASVAVRLGLVAEPPDLGRLSPALRALAGQVAESERLLRLNDPQGVYALCPLDVR
jgi:protease-4